jgi:hypothetical protein
VNFDAWRSARLGAPRTPAGACTQGRGECRRSAEGALRFRSCGGRRDMFTPSSSARSWMFIASPLEFFVANRELAKWEIVVNLGRKPPLCPSGEVVSLSGVTTSSTTREAAR